MTIQELIDQLNKFDKSTEVMVDVDGYHCQVQDLVSRPEGDRVVIYLGQTEGIDY